MLASAVVKGGCSATNVNRITPQANKSTDYPLYGIFLKISGAMYYGVPSSVLRIPFPSAPYKGAAKPKSAILRLKSLSIKIFSYLISL